MKTLIIYYSRGGTTKRIAEELAKKLGSDVDPITICVGWKPTALA
jgi:flavodoxin